MRSVLFFDGLVIIWVYRCFFSLVARVATLGNSCNLHKSKMAAIDSGWDTIIQLVKSEQCVIHLYKIICTWGIDFCG